MPIGYEMTLRNHLRQRDINQDWVIRVYHDGTALYRPYKLGWMRYPTERTIREVLDYFFYKENELIEDTRYGHSRTHVLRRKPLNPQFVAPASEGFGDFLTSKYNHGGTQ